MCACASGFYDALYGILPPSPQCVPCPLGGVCDTGFVAASAGWWRENTTSDAFYKCPDEMRCLAEIVQGPFSPPPVGGNGTSGGQRRLQQQLVAANASAPTNCAPTFTGPLCSLCVPGTAPQGSQCLPCKASDSFTRWTPREQAALVVTCVVLSACGIALAFFSPLSPRLERFTSKAIVRTRRMSSHLVALPRRCLCCLRKQSEHAVAVDEDEAKGVAAARISPDSAPVDGFTVRTAQRDDSLPSGDEQAIIGVDVRPARRSQMGLSVDADVLSADWHNDFMERRLLFERRQFISSETQQAPSEEQHRVPATAKEVAAAVHDSQVAGAETAALGLATSGETEMALFDEDDGDGDGDGDESEDEEEEDKDVLTVLYAEAQKLADKVSSLTRVLVNFYQISSCAWERMLCH